MQTIPVSEAVTDLVETMGTVRASFEACAEFAPSGDCSPVCGACGWLEADHAPEGAEVRTLSRRPRPRPSGVPRRLAS